MYSGDEGGILSDIRLKAMHFGSPFSVQIFATTLDARRPEKENEAISGELCVLLFQYSRKQKVVYVTFHENSHEMLERAFFITFSSILFFSKMIWCSLDLTPM